MMKKLVIIPTPIGNLKDLSLAVIEALQECDVLLCESISAAQRLYGHIEADVPKLVRYWQQNDHEILGQIDQWEGSIIGLISDAGTPAISDPGYTIVKCWHDRGWPVLAIPGPCAATCALSMSGIPTTSFQFKGFLSAKTVARKKQLGSIGKSATTTVLYESPRRVIGLLEDIMDVFGEEHLVFIAKELTKIHERYTRGPVKQCLRELDDWCLKGEFVLVLASGEVEVPWRVLADILSGYLSTQDAAKVCREVYSISKTQVYEYLLSKKC